MSPTSDSSSDPGGCMEEGVAGDGTRGDGGGADEGGADDSSVRTEESASSDENRSDPAGGESKSEPKWEENDTEGCRDDDEPSPLPENYVGPALIPAPGDKDFIDNGPPAEVQAQADAKGCGCVVCDGVEKTKGWSD